MDALSRTRPLIRADWPLRCPASACIEAFTLLRCSLSPSQWSLHSCTRLHTVCDMHKLMALLDCLQAISEQGLVSDVLSRTCHPRVSEHLNLIACSRTARSFALRFRTRGGRLLQLGC